MSEKIVAVVVTYNRKELLLECITALNNQTSQLDVIYIIDNNSTDGTYEFLNEHNIFNNEKNKYIKLDENIGGAGGFYEGMKLAYKNEAQWIWIMDDDTVPNDDALEKLIEAKSRIKEEISFISSNAWNIDEKECINHGKINYFCNKEGYYTYRKYLEFGILGLESATFVACLINAKAIEKCGLPVRDYFIWGDDIEYTTRLTRYFGNGYQCGTSKVIHKTKGNVKNSILIEENSNKLKFWFFLIRNSLINSRAYEKNYVFIKLLLKYQILSVLCIVKPKVKYRLKKFIAIHKALFAFVLKKYDYRAFRDRFNVDVKYKEI